MPTDPDGHDIAFEAEIIHWRGPSPFFFAPVPQALAGTVKAAARAASYGWGVVPVAARVQGVAFETSLFPRDGTYLLPLKDKVRRDATVTAGDVVRVEMSVRPREGRPVA